MARRGGGQRWTARRLVLGLFARLGLGRCSARTAIFRRPPQQPARLEMIEPTLEDAGLGADSSVVGEFFIEDRALASLKDLPAYVPIAFAVAVEDRKMICTGASTSV